MQHLDEGTLQTWLDRERAGLDPSELAAIESHLAACDACAARLEELESLDGRSQALLSVGREVELESAPFERVVARAAGTRGRRRTLTRLRSLAWAASIVLAVGIGWMTNDLYRGGAPRAPQPALEFEAQSGSVEATDAARSREAVESTRPDAQASGPVADAAPAPSAPAAGGDDRLDGTVERLAAPVDAVAELRADAEQQVAAGLGAQDTEPSAAEPETAVAARQAGAVAQRPADAFADAADAGQVLVQGRIVDDQSGEPIPSVQVFVEGLGVGSLTQQDGTYLLRLPARSDSASTYELTAARIGYRTQTRDVAIGSGDAPTVDFTMPEEALQLQEVVVTGTAQGTQRRALGNAVGRLEAVRAFEWRADDYEAVEDSIGRVLVTVPGLTVLSAETSDDGGARLARIRQRLGEDGTVLTLVQGVPAEGDVDWPIEAEGALASVRVGGLLVTGTAPVSLDSLDVLLTSLR